MYQNLGKFVVGVFVSAVLFSAGANANQIGGKITVSACGLFSEDPAVIQANNMTKGRSSLLGKFSAHGRLVLLEWDNSSYCSASELELFYDASPIIFTAANGDLLYTVIADDPPSSICFNFIDNVSFSGTNNLQVVGGTGRFTGATGDVSLMWDAVSLVNSAGGSYCSAGEGVIGGEVILEQR